MQLAAAARLELKRRLRGNELRHKRCSQTKGKKLNSTAGGKSEVGVRRSSENGLFYKNFKQMGLTFDAVNEL